MNEIGVVVPTVNFGQFSILANDEIIKQGIPLIGKFVGVEFIRDNKTIIAIGTILNFELTNNFAETVSKLKHTDFINSNPTIQKVFINNNELILDCKIISAFDKDTGGRIPFDTPLGVSAKSFFIEDSFLNTILTKKKDNMFYLGKYFGTNIKHPFYLKDFSELKEAYHTLVAGQTGSGKSTLVKMMLSGYAKVSKNINMFILDPVGEFAKSFKTGKMDEFGLNMNEIWKKTGRKSVEIYNLENLAMDKWSILESFMLTSQIFKKELGIKHTENQKDSAEYLISELKRKNIKLSELINNIQTIEEIIKSKEFLKRAYSNKERRIEIENTMNIDEEWSKFNEKLKEILDRFNTSNKKSINNLIYGEFNPQKNNSFNNGRTIIIDLSSIGWDNDVKYVIIKEIFSSLYRSAKDTYQENIESNFNTLVVIDEAHRLIPKGKGDNDYQNQAKEVLVKSFIETRKFGLGWMVISTRLSNLDDTVYEHSRVKIIGYDLQTGSDGDIIKESFGKDILNYYATLPDPTDPLSDGRQHVFMVSGPICVLSRKAPEFLEVFNNSEDFLIENNIN